MAFAVPASFAAFAPRFAPVPAPAPTPAPAPWPATQEIAEGQSPLSSDLQSWLDEQERIVLVRALQETGFNRTAAAAHLGLNLRQIRYRMARLNINPPGSGGEGDDA